MKISYNEALINEEITYDNAISNPTILQVILNVDMRQRHDGLRLVAMKAGIQLDLLRDGQFVIFLNTKQNYLALYGNRNCLACIKTKHAIDLTVIQYIPRIFMAKKDLNFDKKLKEILEKRLKR